MASLADAVYAVDTKGIVTFVNPAAAALLGWGVDALIGEPAHETFHADAQSPSCGTLDTLRHGHPARGDHDVFVTRDGGRVEVAWASTPIVVDGEVQGAVVA